MKQQYKRLIHRPIIRYVSLVASFVSLFISLNVTAQQSSLPCNSVTSTPFTNANFSNITVISDATGLGGVIDTDNLVNGNLNDFATASFISIPLVSSGSVSFTVADNANTYNAGNFAGFLIQSNLLNLAVLGNITVSTYLGSSATPVETATASSLVGVNSSLISGASEIGFYTTKPFNKIGLTITSAAGLGSYTVYYAVMRGYCATTTPLACNELTRLNAPAFPVIVDPANTGFNGLLTVGSVTDPDNTINASTTDAASLALIGSVAGSGSFAIKLQNQVFDANSNSLVDGYPAGTFAGIDISNPQLIGVDINTGMRVETYYHGVATGDIAANGRLFINGNTSLLTGTGRRLVGLVTTKPFDEIKLTVARGTLSVNVGTVLIYGAVVKRLCAATIACNTSYSLSNPTFPVIIDNNRTGLSGLLGIALTLQDQDNVITPSTTDYAVITNTASAATTASIGVLDPVDTYPAGTFAGFTVNKITGLAAVTLFSRLTVTTYLNGNLVESRSDGDLLDLSVALFGASSGFFNVGFFSSQPFNEIQLSVAPFLDIAALSGQLRVYGAFVDTRSSFGGSLVCALTTNPDFAVTNKNVPVSGNVSTNDKVPAGVTYGPTPTIISQPGGSSPTLTVNSDGTFTFTSATPGMYTYAVPVCVSGNCASQTLTVTVLDPTVNTNNPVANPDVVSTNGATTNPTSVAVNVRANDKPGNQGGTLSIPTIITTPTNGSAAVDGTGNVIYTPNAGFFGTDKLTYQVCETPGTNLCSTATLTINVLTPGGVNTTQAADDYVSAFQGVAVSGNVKTNDSDPEGNTQTVTAQNTTVAGKGNLVLAADGSFTFTPAAGATGPVDFSYVTIDNGNPAASASATLHVLINPASPTAVTNPDFAVTNKNVPVSGNVSTNDKVPAGTTYGPTPTVISQPNGSSPTLTLNPDGTFSFSSVTPGVYTYSVPVCQSGTCNSQTLTVTVLDPTVTNNNPAVNPDVASTTGSSTSPAPVTVNVKANDRSDNPGGTLGTPTISAPPANGSASVDGNGNVVYTPNAGFFGTDKLTYQVCETPGINLCGTATVTINVLTPGGVNTTQAADDYISTYQGIAVSGNVKTNDTDPEGNTQTVTAQNTTIPGKGTFVLATDGSFTFTPTAGATGPVDFSYVVTDNGSPAANAAGTLHVLTNPFMPNPDFAVTTNNIPATGSVATNDMVPVGTIYGPTPTIISQPGNSAPTMTVTSNGSFTFTSGTSGVYTYSIPVCTAGTPSVCTAQTLTVTVLNSSTSTNTNNPVANPDFVTTTGDSNNPGSVSVNIIANDKPGNAGGTLQTPTIPSQPAHGTASIVNGNLVYTPAAGYFGTDIVTYQVCESPSTPTCATANVTITVNAPNSPATVSINDDYVTTTGGTVSGNVLANDTGTGITVSNPGTTVTSSGTLVLTSSGGFTFTPAPGTSGPTTFSYTACDNNAISTCGSATIHILVGQGVPDLTPTILIDNLSFDPSEVGVPRDFIVNISEVKNVSTTGTISFKLAKLTGFTITYSTASGTSQVGRGYANSNSDWTFTEDNDYITVQTNMTIAGFGNKIVGFSVARKSGIPPNTVQSINVTIVPNAGGETNFPNNIAVTSLAAN